MDPADIKARLFRKVALERLSSPEQMDTMMHVVTLRSWLALAPFLGLLLLALGWGFFGSIPTKVTGRSILLQTGGLQEVTTAAAGRITELRVRVGDTVRAGQAVAVLAQPELAAQIQAATDRLAELGRQQREQQAQVGRAQGLSRSLLDQQQVALKAQIAAAQDRIRVLGERIQTQQALLDQGLVTRQTLLHSHNELTAARQEVEHIKGQLQQASLRSAENDKLALQELTMTANQISETRRTLDRLHASLDQTTRVASSHAGRVVELKVGPGNLVAPGQALLTLESGGGGAAHMEVVAYIPAADGKKVVPGMEAQIVPSTVRREEHGFMIGRAASVSDYAATAESMQAVLQNRQLAQELAAGSTPIEVRATLQPAATPSGFRWSSESGPPFAVRSGTLGTAEIVVHRQAPVTLVIPLLKKTLGID